MSPDHDITKNLNVLHGSENEKSFKEMIPCSLEKNKNLMKICAFRAKSLFQGTLSSAHGWDVTGSLRWRRSKGRLPEEDEEFMKALVKKKYQNIN